MDSIVPEDVSKKDEPFLITENMWPRGCVLDCQRGRHRAVCGSNGRLYKSLCAFQRAQCINTHLRTAPRAHCTDSGQSKCQLARSQAIAAGAHTSSTGGGSYVSPAVAIFVPECGPDGHFLQVQCHNQTGYCWCSTPDGKPISGTSVLHVAPNCTDHAAQTVHAPEVVSDSHDDETGVPRPSPDPSRKAAELTAPPFWVTILLNSDPKGNRSVRRPTDSPQTCERERASLPSPSRSARQEERFVPECTADGRYSPVQCHVATGYCWCVRVDTGRPLPGTSARNRLPECSGAEEVQTDTRQRDRPLPGCPGAQKKEFLQSLVRALQAEAEHAGKLNPPRALSSTPPDSPSPSPNPPTSRPHPPPSPSSSPLLGSASPAARAVLESSRPEVALRWHFSRLDVDSSGVLSEREARPLRRYLRRRLKPRRCAKKFSQYCDKDGDRGLTLEELRVCLGL
ncbi:SPARC-related modular calcium-binding protein 1-like [Lampris incognitus]|uniref:SPARC-related modular calcium-binding protein 1-like n=1 Tax=Lampris incognitus TaxID=2546036 RepID=UPI0024B4C769|nr:SPARC-related modular calcium-binding protein 1-like [Lampris incognitus]